MIEGNEKQKMIRHNKKINETLIDQKLYQESLKIQFTQAEEEKRVKELKKKILEQNKLEILQQIKEKEEKEKFDKRMKLEDGRIIKQREEAFLKTMGRIKMKKLNEMDKFGIKQDYRIQLKKFKIV